MIDVLVIGAGWSGLTAATRLADLGHEVVVVEKSRGPGGRSATRRADGFAFDHGAQYLTARTDAFADQVAVWSESGLLTCWKPELAVFGDRPPSSGSQPPVRWIGAGGMSAVPGRLAQGLDCRWQWHARQLTLDTHGWKVQSDAGERLQSRSLLLTAPPAQSAALLGPDHALADELASVSMQPCWALMVVFEQAPAVDFEAAFVNAGPMSWVASQESRHRDSAGQASGSPWVMHASADWSRRHLEDAPESVVASLHSALLELDSGFDVPIRVGMAHRWRYAMANAPLSGPTLGCDESRLVVAGDWCAGERIEGAWISGVAASERLSAMLRVG